MSEIREEWLSLGIKGPAAAEGRPVLGAIKIGPPWGRCFSTALRSGLVVLTQDIFLRAR